MSITFSSDVRGEGWYGSRVWLLTRADVIRVQKIATEYERVQRSVLEVPL
jgi:hypothetical protein